MDVLSNFFIFIVNAATVPHASGHIFIGKFVEYSIASENNEIVVLLNLEDFHLGQCGDHVWISPTEFIFSFWVAESSGYWEPTGKYSNWTNDKFYISFLLQSVCFNWLSGGGGLVDLSSTRNDSQVLFIFRWLVIKTQRDNLLAEVRWHKSSAVPNIRRIAYVSHNKHHDSARATSLYQDLISMFIFA